VAEDPENTGDDTVVEGPGTGRGAAERRPRTPAAEGQGEGDGAAAGVDWVAETAPGSRAAAEDDLDFLAGWDRYTVVSFLGAGGMGRVYKAYDPSLGRFAALKFLRWNDPVQLERFLREARSQARVDHAHVCKVYEAGHVAGRPYIAMQFIDGETLTECGDSLTLEQKVGTMREVAEAVHAAHRTGLIHRDLKPGNVLLERQEDGSWQPYVLDFGLAWDQEAAVGLTRTGAVTGTPAYLSPEQARGQPLDRRSDVYSLGVVLYELLSGRVPLRAGSLAESLIKVVSENPAPLRRLDPRIPRDLETIVMKCLEKEPQRRYDSARALAADLGRFLDGEAILARRASPLYRAGKWIRRNRALAGVLAGATALLLAGGAWSLRAQWRAEQRARVLQRFSQEVTRVESDMRLASLLPIHDTSREKEPLRRRREAIAEEMGRLGSVAAGPGHYALGRIDLALHDDESALDNLEQAWRLGERSPEVADGLGRVLGILYQKALLVVSESPEEPRERPPAEEPPGAGGKTALPAAESRQRLERRYRVPALAYLRQGGATEAPYVQAMIAFYDKRYDEALAKARQAYREVPWFYEAGQLEAEILLEQAEAAQSRGAYDEALGRFKQAGEVDARLLAVARSEPTLYAAECGRRLRVLLLEREAGSPAEEDFAAAAGDCDRALAIDPDLAEAYTNKAQVFWRWAQADGERGLDPTGKLRQAADLAQRAIALNPREVLAYNHLAGADRGLAQRAFARGQDPGPYLQVAIASLEKSLEIQPQVANTLNGLGNVYVVKARWESRNGRSPVAFLDHGIAYYRQAFAAEPLFIGALANVGMASLDEAEYQIDQGSDALPAIDQAIAVLGDALKRNPKQPAVRNNLGTAYLTLGDYRLRRGEDPRQALDRAVGEFEALLPSGPETVNYLYNIGWAHRGQARWALDQGEDPTAELAAARKAYGEALRQAPEGDICLEAARVERLAATWEAREGRDLTVFARAAAAALARGRELNPRYPDLYQEEAELQRLLAEEAIAHGRPAAEAIRRGRAAAAHALALNPELAEALALSGALDLLASREAGAGDDAKALARQAADALSQALERNPNLRREYATVLAAAKARARAGSGAPH
jgi:eukaryotic-like serine/threonine-protein kinase